ncbi:MAG TPA: acyl-CoA dehydrogenase family protein [Chloroflexota bacterium]|nr:acyl-CoA dehydrogenase family protein [Chloroflexota bacterium]
MYRLNADQEAIVERAREVAGRVIGPNAERVDAEGIFPRASIEALGTAGLLGLTIPAELGGLGQGPRVACAVLDEVAQRCASTAMVYLMHLCGVACYLAAPAKTERYLRAAARGEHLSTLAWSERASRSHFWAPVSQATQVDGRVTLSAQKSFVTSAGQADGYVVSTQRPGAAQPTESTLYLVTRDDGGLSVAGAWMGLGMRGNASAPMALEGVELGDDRALSEPGKGFDLMLSILPVFQLGNAAVSVGIAEAAVAATQRHLTTARIEYLDAALASLPEQRARLAQMRIRTDRARAHLVSAIDAVEDPGPTTMLLVLESKASAAEAALDVTETAMRACGGAAFARRLSVERHMRDAHAAGVMAPTTDHLYDFIGRALCGMELF